MARFAELVRPVGDTEFLDLDKIQRASLDPVKQILEILFTGRYIRFTQADEPALYTALLAELRGRVDYVRIPPAAP